jgi:putative colanic acid biosynthesis acetyltransferase WcaF
VTNVRLDKFNASIDFDRGAGKFKMILWYLIKITFFLSAFPYPSSFKRVNIHFPWKMSVGNHVWIGEEVFILNFETITIGNQVCISQRAFLCGGNHNYKKPSMPYRNGAIILEDGCWIGANVFVGPDVTIGIDTVIVASSVVTKSLASNGIYRGNPVQFIKNRW